MATKKKFSDYDNGFRTLIYAARRQGGIQLTFSTHREALNIRNRFYGYRDAALEDLETSREIGLLIPLIETKIIGNVLYIRYDEKLMKRSQR